MPDDAHYADIELHVDKMQQDEVPFSKGAFGNFQAEARNERL